MATAIVRDETATGKAIDHWPLTGLPERISARELVRLRVREEVARFNAQQPRHFRGLVQPTDTEATLNGYRVTPGRRLDWEQQADAACAAFARNGFLLLVGHRQIEDLDEEIDLLADPDVAFVRLVQLVGG
ncbi:MULTISPECIES: hypothetical protein [Micromonospora]|uniref:hypothetical protein n=1 Tax=Micromonospora TaxID=1873 RepID=UPI001B35C80E|nr:MULTISPECIES: hypothetical protein [unclassified Micromonospora]MBQ0980447.1 hypothetical protein [Micromonospora sp. M61]MBQ1038252.1 hypothetical protein [Micromonospora sp. C81]WSK47521.1 hypothetical protein OG423_26500 [Micromonospora zamorensis]